MRVTKLDQESELDYQELVVQASTLTLLMTVSLLHISREVNRQNQNFMIRLEENAAHDVHSNGHYLVIELYPLQVTASPRS